MSSAILYLVIIAIWAGVLIPRWLKRDSSQAKAARASELESAESPESSMSLEPSRALEPSESPESSVSLESSESPEPSVPPESSVPPELSVPPESPQSQDELTGDEPIEVDADVGAGGAGVQMADGDAYADADAGSGRVAGAGWVAGAGRGRVDEVETGPPDEADLPGYELEEPTGLGPADPHTHRRMLVARRRMLVMLTVLAGAAVGIAVVGLAAWWVAIPPAVMLGGYLVLLREARHADAERALILADSEYREVQRRLREAREAVAARRREEAQTARVIDISERVRDELYDQYAEDEPRAVGD